MKKENKIKVGISIGDINGIGMEVILKTFADNRMLDFCTPIIFGSSKSISTHKKKINNKVPIHGINNIKEAVNHKVNLYNIWKEDVEIEFGKQTPNGGKYALKSLKAATKALKNNEVDVLVTAPINKNNIQSEEFNFKGHTEYLESIFNGKSLMILMSNNLRIGLITGHIPIQEVAKTITPDLIKAKVINMNNSLIKDFNIDKPKIAILGLNPHCGDNGVIGKEDDEIITPTIKELNKKGILAFGPYASDGFFGSNNYQNFDGILAMYHDQGLAPFKALSFGNGVNFTAGLDKIRTSPDHGTAFEIAGENKANEGSFREAVYKALAIYKNRKMYEELHANPLKISKKK